MSTTTDAAIDSAVAAAASAAGLTVDDGIDAATLPDVAGPFISHDLGAEAGPLKIVAVRDDLSSGAEELLAALSSAVAPDLASPATAAVPSGAELAARFDGPFSVVALTDGDDPVALVVTAVERRGLPEPPPEPEPEPLSAPLAKAAGGLDKLANVGLDVSVELGRTRATLSEVLAYDVGSVVELDRAAGAPVDIRVNGTLLAHGEVVLIDDEYAVRVTAIIDPMADR